MDWWSNVGKFLGSTKDLVDHLAWLCDFSCHIHILKCGSEVSEELNLTTCDNYDGKKEVIVEGDTRRWLERYTQLSKQGKEKSKDMKLVNENVIGFVKMQTSGVKNISLLDYKCSWVGHGQHF